MTAKRKNRDEIEQRDIHRNVADFLSWRLELVAAKSRADPYGTGRYPRGGVGGDEPEWIEQVAADAPWAIPRLVLPLLEYRHAERNADQMEDFSVRRLQRAFWGFLGRARFRRLKLRLLEGQRQRRQTRVVQEAYAALRARRRALCVLVQAVTRGYNWRRQLVVLKHSALLCQTKFRMYRAQLWLAAEKRRRSLGPEVHEMFRKGIVISGRTLVLIIYRCGTNYKMMGEDLVNNLRYQGNAYTQDVSSLLEVRTVFLYTYKHNV